MPFLSAAARAARAARPAPAARSRGRRLAPSHARFGAAAALALAGVLPVLAQTPGGPRPADDAANASAVSSASVQRRLAPEPWRFSATPYVWLPTVNAHLNLPLPPVGGGGGTGGGGTGGTGGTGGGLLDGLIETEIGPNDYLTRLNFALMLAGEARRGPWSVFADYIGLSASGEASRINGVSVGGDRVPAASLGTQTDTRTTLRASIVTLMGGHSLVETERYRIDGVAGLRAARLGADLDWSLSASVALPDGTAVLARSGSTGVTRRPVDAVVGLRGRWQLDEHWAFPWHVDVGAGSSDLTWQAFFGASRRFSWGELMVAWRHLEIRDERREVFRRLTLGGPTVGATFRF